MSFRQLALTRALTPYLAKRLAGSIDDFHVAWGSMYLHWDEGTLATNPDDLLTPPQAPWCDDGDPSLRFARAPGRGRPFHVPSLFDGMVERRDEHDADQRKHHPQSWLLRASFPSSIVRDPTFSPTQLPKAASQVVASNVCDSLKDFSTTHSQWVDQDMLHAVLQRWSVLASGVACLEAPYTIDCRHASSIEFEVALGRDGKSVHAHYITGSDGQPLTMIALPHCDDGADLARYFSQALRVELLRRSLLKQKAAANHIDSASRALPTSTQLSGLSMVDADLLDMSSSSGSVKADGAA